ncbi:MAG: type IV toxin-antitoxin system AbiEi family antitoxin domain-containing protein [Actinomycetota bacterium]
MVTASTMPRRDLLSEVARVQRSQKGLITRAQARKLGVADSTVTRLVRTGSWERVHPRVYLDARVPHSWEQAVLAAVLWGQPDACASHRAAAAVWGFDGIPSSLPEIISRRDKRPVSPGVIVHRAADLLGWDVTTEDGIDTTNPTRTLLDLGNVAGEDAVEEALESALRMRLTTPACLRWRLNLATAPGSRGAATLKKLLELRTDAEPAAESRLEVRFCRLLRAARLPVPDRQHPFKNLAGERGRIDFFYPHAGLAIELSSYRYHGGRKSWLGDLDRWNFYTSRGWRSLHFSWEDVHHRPGEVVSRIRRELQVDLWK